MPVENASSRTAFCLSLKVAMTLVSECFYKSLVLEGESGQNSPTSFSCELSLHSSVLDSGWCNASRSSQAFSPLIFIFFWGYLRSQDHSKIRQTGSSDSLFPFFNVAQDLDRSLDGILALFLFSTPDMSWEVDELLKNGSILLQGITLLQ